MTSLSPRLSTVSIMPGIDDARARAHRDEQRILAVAEFFAGDAADLSERRFDLRL